MKDIFIAESAKLQATSESSGAGLVVSDQAIRDRINLMQSSNLDDYNKIFLNLEQSVNKERIKLVVVDNILSVCDYFIKADGTVDFFERAGFLVSHSRKLKKLAY